MSPAPLPLPFPVDTRTACLPTDCALLPIGNGRLLVSRSHATYCRVPEADIAAVQSVLIGKLSLASLDHALLGALHTHGFFGPPRPWRQLRPNVQLQLTNRCNLHCRYCSTNAGPAMPGELPRRRWFQLLDEIAGHLPEAQVSLLGGEPFLLPWTIDLAEAVIARAMPLVVFTNATPLTAKRRLARRVAHLIARGAQICVSLAGASAEVCDTISGGARFEAALAAVQAVAAHGPPPELHMIVMPANVDDLALNFHLLRRRLPAGIKVTFSLLGPRGRERGRNLFPSRAELEAAIDRIAFESGERVPAPQPTPTTERRDGCACALGMHLSVRADGAVFGCYQMEELQGKLQPGGLAQICAQIAAEVRPAHQLPLCRDCALASLCGAGCRSENLVLTGDGATPACGPWRVRVLCELLAQDRPDAVKWPAQHLLAEAHALGIEAPSSLARVIPSRALVEVGRLRGRGETSSPL